MVTWVEVVVTDKKSLVTIHPYRDVDCSKITEDTRKLTFLVCGVPGVGENVSENARKVLIRNVTDLYQGTLVESY